MQVNYQIKTGKEEERKELLWTIRKGFLIDNILLTIFSFGILFSIWHRNQGLNMNVVSQFLKRPCHNWILMDAVLGRDWYDDFASFVVPLYCFSLFFLL